MDAMMTWVKLDDGLPENRKVASVSVGARWAYVSSICYASRNLTDGYVPSARLSALDGTPKIARELVTAGLWHAVQGGWEIHDYLQHNRSKAQQAADRDNKAKGGRASAVARYGVTETEQPVRQTFEQAVEQEPDRVFLSLSPSLSVPTEQDLPGGHGEREIRTETEQAVQQAVRPKPIPAPRKTVPTEEWAAEMRERYGPKLRDFEETLRFHMNGNYYRGCADKCQYLETKLKAAAEREAGASFSQGPKSSNGAKPPYPGPPPWKHPPVTGDPGVDELYAIGHRQIREDFGEPGPDGFPLDGGPQNRANGWWKLQEVRA